MIERLLVLSFALLPIATVAADRAVPKECIRLARKAGLPDRLNPQQLELALALLERADPNPEVRRCREAIRR